MDGFRDLITGSLLPLSHDPPGIAAWPEEQHTPGCTLIGACVTGPPDTPYEGGVFQLRVELSARYPLEPPRVRFATPVYHPNIDETGLICLDTLKSAPQRAGAGGAGYWTPSLTLSSVLVTVQQLLASPNPDDGLRRDVAAQFVASHAAFLAEARRYTRAHASPPKDGALGVGAGVWAAAGGSALTGSKRRRDGEEAGEAPTAGRAKEAAGAAESALGTHEPSQEREPASSSAAAAAAAAGIIAAAPAPHPAAPSRAGRGTASAARAGPWDGWVCGDDDLQLPADAAAWGEGGDGEGMGEGLWASHGKRPR